MRYAESAEFALDVWVIHASDDTIPASRLLDWLGY